MKLKFKTISSTIFSPRIEKALYKGVDFCEISKEDMIGLKKEERETINIVYPFYTYEDRNLLPNSFFAYAEEYYIPASSLKGALLGSKQKDDENKFRNKMIFQNIRISSSCVKLKNLYKFQYLYQEIKDEENNERQKNRYKTPKFASFFPRIAIEMIESEKEFEGEILFKEADMTEKFFKEKLYESFSITKKKLGNYIEEIDKRITEIDLWIRDEKINDSKKVDSISKLKEIKRTIQKQVECDKNMVFLGGYKGLLGSLSQVNDIYKIRNGFYIDRDTLLPYGLVEVHIESDDVS